MPDYKESRAFADFWLNEIAPNLQHLITTPVSFPEYFNAYYKYPSAPHTFGLPNPYVYSLEWMKRFKGNCVTFLYAHPDDVAKGSAPLSALYQLSPTLHCICNVSMWREKENNEGYVTTFMVYENFDEVLSFLKDNMDILKNPNPEEKVGFAAPVFPSNFSMAEDPNK